MLSWINGYGTYFVCGLGIAYTLSQWLITGTMDQNTAILAITGLVGGMRLRRALNK